MGWCSATRIFDKLCDKILKEGTLNKKDLIIEVIDILQDEDWDCERDSYYWDDPIIQEIFKERHPAWFDEDEV